MNNPVAIKFKKRMTAAKLAAGGLGYYAAKQVAEIIYEPSETKEQRISKATRAAQVIIDFHSLRFKALTSSIAWTGRNAISLPLVF